jgi:hypothetical protein
MGFTSTQRDALGPHNVVSFETLPGMTDQYPGGDFARGTTCISHLTLDLTAWYGAGYADRVARMISPR